MQTQVIFDTKFISVDYQPVKKLLHVTWKGWASEDDYRKVIDIQSDTVIRKNVAYLLVDIRDFKGTTPANQKYTNDSINNAINTSKNIKKVAYVVGKNIFAQFTLTNIRKEIDGSLLTTNAFLSTQDAHDWLLGTN